MLNLNSQFEEACTEETEPETHAETQSTRSPKKPKRISVTPDFRDPCGEWDHYRELWLMKDDKYQPRDIKRLHYLFWDIWKKFCKLWQSDIDAKEEHVAELQQQLETNPCDSTKKDLEERTRELEEWYELSATESWLQTPTAVEWAIRKESRRTNPRSNWEVTYWHCFDKKAIEVDYKFMKSILTEEGFHSSLFEPPGLDEPVIFKKIPKVFLRETLEEIEFATIKARGGQNGLELKDSNGITAVVSEKWLRQKSTLPSAFLEEVSSHIKAPGSGTKTFACPPGKLSALASSDTDRMQALCSNTKGFVPPIQFPQDPGSDTCMANSFASALFHFGLKDEAKQIHCEGILLPKTNQYVGRFIDLVHKHIGKKGFRMQKVKGRAYDPIKHTAHLPVIGILHAKGRGGIGLNHSVCFLDDLIFEPSLSYPVPCTKHSLDVICKGAFDCLGKAWALTSISSNV